MAIFNSYAKLRVPEGSDVLQPQDSCMGPLRQDMFGVSSPPARAPSAHWRPCEHPTCRFSEDMVASWNSGTQKWMVYSGKIPWKWMIWAKNGWFIMENPWKSHLEVDDDWGYPCFRRPPGFDAPKHQSATSWDPSGRCTRSATWVKVVQSCLAFQQIQKTVLSLMSFHKFNRVQWISKYISCGCPGLRLSTSIWVSRNWLPLSLLLYHGIVAPPSGNQTCFAGTHPLFLLVPDFPIHAIYKPFGGVLGHGGTPKSSRSFRPFQVIRPFQDWKPMVLAFGEPPFEESSDVASFLLSIQSINVRLGGLWYDPGKSWCHIGPNGSIIGWTPLRRTTGKRGFDPHI